MFETPPHHVARRACTFVAALAVTLTGCSDAPTSVHGALQASTALPLELLSTQPPVEGSRQVRRLELPRELAPWSVDGGPSKWLPQASTDPSAGPALQLLGDSERTLTIPGPFFAADFNRVQFDLQIVRSARIRVHLWRDGAPRLARTPRCLASSEAQAISACFPNNASLGGSFDALSITIPAGAGGVILSGIELIHEPVASWFPRPGDAAQPMTVDEDTRTAVSVSGSTSLGGEFFASREHELRFSCAYPETLRPVRPKMRLVVTLRDARGSEHREELPLPRKDAIRGWHEARLPLSELAGEQVERLNWSVSFVGDVPPGFVTLIAEQRLVLPKEQPTTVLLVTSDTHRADHLGLAGHSVQISTPSLDRLAQRGVLFEQALSTSNITLPSHVALMTGVHPRDTGILDNATSLSHDAATLAEAFRAAGYRTFGAVSASHLGDVRFGIGQGFERFSGPKDLERSADRTVDQLEGWLAESTDEPLFIWLHVFDAHGPYEPPAEFLTAAHDGELTGDVIEAGASLEAEATRSASASVANSTARVGDQPREAQLRAYRGEISFLDQQLGRLLEAPRFADAIVAVTADHGEVLGNHEIWFSHQGLYMDTVWVPLILAWPGAPRGERVEGRVQHLGLARTLLDLAGLSGVEFPGENLLVENAANDEAARFAISTRGQAASVTHGDWHLILSLEQHKAGNPEFPSSLRELHQVELYHLASDPGCSVDLQQRHSQRAHQLRHALIAWLGRTQDRGWARAGGLDAAGVARLEALGYTGDLSAPSEGWIDRDCECEWCERYP